MIDPRTLTVQEWTSLVNQSIASFASPVTLKDESEWLSWAITVMSIPSIVIFSPPDPRLFDDWLSWAERFVQCVFI